MIKFADLLYDDFFLRIGVFSPVVSNLEENRQ
jgi:hypothetical protein